MGREKTYDLTAGKVQWSEISLHANEKACKPWAQRITGTHEKYGVDGEWLDKQRIDGDVFFDLEDVGPGDYIKVSGASHSNKKHSYWRVQHVTDELSVERVDEAEVIEAIEGDAGDDGLDDLRNALIQAVSECDDEETLNKVKALMIRESAAQTDSETDEDRTDMPEAGA
jgi:hypothetical protein